jgi:hypothetical protein
MIMPSFPFTIFSGGIPPENMLGETPLKINEGAIPPKFYLGGIAPVLASIKL